MSFDGGQRREKGLTLNCAQHSEGRAGNLGQTLFSERSGDANIKRWDDVVFEFCEVSAVAGLERSFRPGRVKSNPQIRDFYAGQSLSGAGPRFSGNWNSWDNCSTLGDAVESHALLDSGDSVSG